MMLSNGHIILRNWDAFALWLPAIWALSVLLFCFAAYRGVQKGIMERNPTFAAVTVLMSNIKATPEEFALFHEIRMRGCNLGFSPDELQVLFNEAIIPLYVDEDHLIRMYSNQPLNGFASVPPLSKDEFLKHYLKQKLLGRVSFPRNSINYKSTNSMDDEINKQIDRMKLDEGEMLKCENERMVWLTRIRRTCLEQVAKMFREEKTGNIRGLGVTNPY